MNEEIVKYADAVIVIDGYIFGTEHIVQVYRNSNYYYSKEDLARMPFLEIKCQSLFSARGIKNALELAQPDFTVTVI